MSFRNIFGIQIPKYVRNIHRYYHNVNAVQTTHPNLTFFVSKRYNNHKSLKCWQCGVERKKIGELFCEQCSHIQIPHEKNNFFKIFEIDENFDIDQKQLTRKYRQLQSLLHPDKFTNKSSKEKDISEEFSSLVNKAYHTLQTPLKRAIHLLHLRGASIDEDQKVDDPGFLMKIMELNEEVEGADTDEKLKNFKQKNDSDLLEIANEIKRCFETNQTEKAKQTIIIMKYYNSVSLRVNNLMREKGIVD